MKVVAAFALQITQFANQVKIRSNSQLTGGISRVLPKLLQYFNGTAISGFAIATLVLFVSLELNLNDSESVMLSLGSSLQYCHRLPDVFS